MSDELLEFLQGRDRPYCFRCLRQAFPYEPVDIRDRLEVAQHAGAPILIGDGLCAICGQVTAVVAYVTGDPALVRLAQATAISDAAELAGLLRRRPGICLDCAATKLALTIRRVGDAVRILAKTGVVNEAPAICSGCGRSTPVVLSLRP
jgi:hypothetical protein